MNIEVAYGKYTFITNDNDNGVVVQKWGKTYITSITICEAISVLLKEFVELREEINELDKENKELKETLQCCYRSISNKLPYGLSIIPTVKEEKDDMGLVERIRCLLKG